MTQLYQCPTCEAIVQIEPLMGEEKYMPESITCHHAGTDHAMEGPEKMIQQVQGLDQDHLDGGWKSEDDDEST